MSIPAEKLYPRTGDKQTVYLRAAVKGPNISVGPYTMYNDFVHDPADFEKNNVLYHYPIKMCIRDSPGAVPGRLWPRCSARAPALR